MLKESKRTKGYISLIFMIVISCGAQILMLMKTSVVAGIFGTTEAMDAFNLANSIVSFVFGFIASGITTIIIPEYLSKNNRKATDTFISIIYSLLFLVIAIILLLRYQIVGMLSNRNDAYFSLVGNMLLLLLASQYFYSITNITAAFFQAKERYIMPKAISLFAQLSVLITLMIWGNLTIIEYTLLIASGNLLNFVIDFITARIYGWKYKPCFDFKNPETRLLLKRFLPIIFSTGIYRLSLMVDSIIAEQLGVGRITTLAYSSQIVAIIQSVIIGNLLIYIYPKIVNNVKQGKPKEFFWEQIAFFHCVVCLLIAGFFAVGREGVALLFERGAFDANATWIVYVGALIYLFGQQFNIIRDMIYRYFYALGDTKAPAMNSLFVSIANIAISIVLVVFIGYYGIIWGTVLASFFSMLLILFKFRRKEGLGVSITRISWTLFNNFLALAITIALVILTKNILPEYGTLISICLYGIETVIIYAGLIYLTNRKIVETLKQL